MLNLQWRQSTRNGFKRVGAAMSFRWVFPLLSIAAMNYFYVWAMLYSTRPISHRVSHKEGKEERRGGDEKSERKQKRCQSQK